MSENNNFSTKNLNTIANVTKRNEQSLPAIERNSSLPLINSNFDSSIKVSNEGVEDLKIEGRLKYRP